MKWNIVADSAIDLFTLESPQDDVNFSTVPFVISVEDKDYIDDETLVLSDLIAAMKESKVASKTACPAPGAWYDEFKKEGNVIAITITSNLSGSYNSACVAKEMVLEEAPDKKIAIIDSLSTGPEMVLILRKLCELIKEGNDFDAVIEKVHQYMNHTHVSFALSSFDNLVKNGRMNKVTGFIANKLGLLGIGIASERGTVEVKGVARGKRKAIAAIIEDMKQRGTYINEVIISHCYNEEFANQVKEAILLEWPSMKMTIMPLRGLCSYYAEEHGLIIGF